MAFDPPRDVNPMPILRERNSWHMMRSRCLNPKNSCYAYYGGRGISVCARWGAFANFLADMGPRPAGTTLDRINNDGNYEPGNCRWATRFEQNANRRNSHGVVSVCGHPMAISAAARALHLQTKSVCRRFHEMGVWALYGAPPSGHFLRAGQAAAPRSGHRGVSWYRRSAQWRVAVRLGGKKTHVGYFATTDAAVAARDRAEGAHRLTIEARS